jgi:hypothetical protein
MFSEAEYYAAYKKVRNKFRKYRYHELIGEALEYINAPAIDKIDPIRRLPWMVMLFIKWVLLDDQYPNTKGKITTKHDVTSLLQEMYEMSDKLRMPTEYDHYSLFLKNIAFQQFIYQVDFYYAHLSRQSILFSELDKNHYIHKEFVKHTGLEVQDFLDLSLMTLARFLDTNETFLPEKWFSNVNAKYSTKKINSFLVAISKDINDIRQTLLSNDNGKRLAAENYELTPFIEFPLIKVAGKYILTNKNILFRRLEYFVYDIMRSIDAAKFMDKFGELFERYVEQSLKYSEATYITEKEIKKLLGPSGNQIDFLIRDGASNIFIDAKAVEMNSHGKTTHSTEILRHKTKSSILKAIKQSHDVIKKLTDTSNSAIPSCKNNYLLVITFKELYLGNGTTYYEIIAKEKIDKIYDEYKNYPRIPPENMYFITIGDLDILTDILKKKRFTLSAIIEVAKNNDKDPATKKFDFQQHIQTLNINPQTSDYLTAEKDDMFERILEAAKNQQ